MMKQLLSSSFIGATLVFGVLQTRTARAEDADPNLNGQVQTLTDAVKAEGPQFLLAGKIEPGQKEKYAVNGEDFSTDEATQIYGGNISLGVDAEVSGMLHDGTEKVARKVVIRDTTQQFTAPRAPAGTDAASQPPQPSGFE